MSIEREQNYQLAEKIAALFVPPEKVLENVMDIVELMDASSTGGDALREAERAVLEAAIVWRNMMHAPVYGSPCDDIRLAQAIDKLVAERAAPPLIKQEAEAKLALCILGLQKRIHFIEKHNQHFERCESRWCNPTADDNPAIEIGCGNMTIFDNACAERRAASKQEVVAPVGEATGDWCVCQCGHYYSEHGSEGRCYDVNRSVEPIVRCHCDKFVMALSNEASSVSGPSEGLREAELKVLQEANTFHTYRNEIQREELFKAVRVLREARSAAGTSKQERMDEPAEEDL